MRHDGTGKQARGKRSHMKPPKNRKAPARADESDGHGHHAAAVSRTYR